MGRQKYNTLVLNPSQPLVDSRWESFAHLVAAGEKQGKAALLAGYNPAGAPARATALVRKPVIQARIAYLQGKSQNIAITRVSLSKSEVLQGLRKVLNIAVGNEQVPSKEGDSMVYAIDLSAANRAIELTGKELGMFVEHRVLGIQDLRSASVDQLYGILSELDSAIEARQLTDGSQPDPQAISKQSAADPTTTPSGLDDPSEQ